MKHPSNRELFELLERRAAASGLRRSAPTSSPPRSAKMLGDTFVLEVERLGAADPFRLAGTRLCALFGRELKGESFNRLWHTTGQTAMRELIAVVMDEKVGVVASVTGATADDTLLPVNLEMLLLPLASDTRSEARVIGALAPMAAPYWLGAKAVGAAQRSACSGISARRSRRPRRRGSRRLPAGSPSTA